MYKVFVIDDEPRVRKGLARLIPQLDADWQVIGEAKNGQEGLEKIKSCHPDLVFTDIRMPKMNGLDLLSALRTESIDVVILTGYGHFEYAQTAIKFGAFDYLLKPTKPDEVSDVLSRVKRKLREKEHQLKNQEINMDLSTIWKEWLLDPVNHSDVPVRLAPYLLNDVEDVQIFVIEVDHFEELITEDRWGERQLVLFAIRNVIQDLLSTENQLQTTFLFVHGGQLFYMLKETVDVKALAAEAMILLKKWLKISVSIGISERQQGSQAIPDCFQQAREAIQNKWIYGQSSFCDYQDFQIDEKMLEKYPIQVEELLLIEIREGKVEKSLHLFQQFLEEIVEEQITYKLYRRFCLQLVSAIIRLLYEYKVDQLVLKEHLHLYDQLEESPSMDQLHVQIEELIRETISAIQWVKSGKMKNKMTDALNFIHEHFMQDLSLEEVAQCVHMSPSYFSTIFKQKMKLTFIEYLTRYRVEKAKQLMSDSGLKLYQIAQMVGYQDYKYFSRVFKKVMGVTPTQYSEFFFREEAEQ